MNFKILKISTRYEYIIEWFKTKDLEYGIDYSEHGKKTRYYSINNNGEIIDHVHDKLHAGPKCHALLANDLHNHIVKHFDHWLSNK